VPPEGGKKSGVIVFTPAEEKGKKTQVGEKEGGYRGRTTATGGGKERLHESSENKVPITLTPETPAIFFLWKKENEWGEPETGGRGGEKEKD